MAVVVEGGGGEVEAAKMDFVAMVLRHHQETAAEDRSVGRPSKDQTIHSDVTILVHLHDQEMAVVIAHGLKLPSSCGSRGIHNETSNKPLRY